MRHCTVSRSPHQERNHSAGSEDSAIKNPPFPKHEFQPFSTNNKLQSRQRTNLGANTNTNFQALREDIYNMQRNPTSHEISISDTITAMTWSCCQCSDQNPDELGYCRNCGHLTIECIECFHYWPFHKLLDWALGHISVETGMGNMWDFGVERMWIVGEWGLGWQACVLR